MRERRSEKSAKKREVRKETQTESSPKRKFIRKKGEDADVLKSAEKPPIAKSFPSSNEKPVSDFSPSKKPLSM